MKLSLRIFIISTIITLLSTNVLYAQTYPVKKNPSQLITLSNKLISQRINSLNNIRTQLDTLESENIISSNNIYSQNITTTIQNTEKTLEQLQNNIDKNNMNMANLKIMASEIFVNYIYRIQIPIYSAQLYLLTVNHFESKDKITSSNLENIIKFEEAKNISTINIKNNYNNYIYNEILIMKGINSSLNLTKKINTTNYITLTKTLKNNIITINSYLKILHNDIFNFDSNFKSAIK